MMPMVNSGDKCIAIRKPSQASPLPVSSPASAPIAEGSTIQTPTNSIKNRAFLPFFAIFPEWIDETSTQQYSCVDDSRTNKQWHAPSWNSPVNA